MSDSPEAPNIFSYPSYRSYLRDLLKAKGYSYRSFAERYKQIVSFISLAKALSQGRGKMQKKPGYNMSAETLARLGSALQLSEEELGYLVLLKLENDAEQYKGAYGGTLRRIAQGLLEKYVNEGEESSSSDTQISELFHLLPSHYQKKILSDAIVQGEIYISRQKGKPGTKKIEELIEEIKKNGKGK